MQRRNVSIKPDSLERVEELTQKINEIRVSKKMKPLMDSTLIHELLETALDVVDVTPEGNIYIARDTIEECDSLDELKKENGSKDSDLYYRK